MGTIFWIAAVALLVVLAGLTGHSIETYGQRARERRLAGLVHDLREERRELAALRQKLRAERRRAATSERASERR